MPPTAAITAAINLRLGLLDLPIPHGTAEAAGAYLVSPLIARQRELNRRLGHRLCVTDGRIQAFLDAYLADAGVQPQLPRATLVLDVPGLARELSLPVDGDEFRSPLLASYRLANGVLHNPANDRRTTAGVFHVVEGGLPIPDDKLAVPTAVFARLLTLAFQPPAADMVLPFTANEAQPASCFVSLLLRPLVQPAVPGRSTELRMETRFIAPGGLVANLDFVEGIFGNAGDPYLPEHDASLDPAGWTGHTGCVILAPHLTAVTKSELGLPHIDQATDRQRRDGMCWSDESELYNGGQAFKVCARDERGVIVTVIADNYFGYCKKEVKTQISFSANLLGAAEEEHAGGAAVYPAYNMGSEFVDDRTPASYSIADVVARDPERFVLQPQGHAIDATRADIVLVPGGATYSLRTRTVSWPGPDGREQSIRLLPGTTYMAPNGYRVHARARDADPTQWILVGTSPTATVCHKPATVSGGGKSEISKSIRDAFVVGNAYVPDFNSAADHVQVLFDRDYSHRFADPRRNGIDHRPILSDERSLGSVIKLLTPSSDYNADYNAFLESIPPYVKELLYTVKRYWSPGWGRAWRTHFTVGLINGRQGNSVRLDGEKVMINMLRVGFEPDGSWRLFSLRPDFSPAAKVQVEDDITASTVVAPPDWMTADGAEAHTRKYVQNCEYLLFQRPDDAILRGYDKQAERDLSQADTFISNFEPLSHADARALVEDMQALSEFTQPMAGLIRAHAAQPDDAHPEWFVCSAMPRLVNGVRTKNPRYLQRRPDLANASETSIADLASHMIRRLPASQVAPLPVDVVAAGRRNNPPEDGVPALCAYNPLHYMELPELFMEFISSMTGKSPSTTGAGSEGAMTKGPFNALPAIVDLNAALLSFALTGYDGWLSSAGWIGPHVRVDHDISMLIPELFARMTEPERRAATLIAAGCLERVPDIEVDGRCVEASRLGYRMTERFATTYFGRIFLDPHTVFTPDILRPELQDAAIFAHSVDVIVATHQRVAQAYIDDGTIALAVPPLRALLEFMAQGHSAEGWTLDSPELRSQFTRAAILASDWYWKRIEALQAEHVDRCERGLANIRTFMGTRGNEPPAERLGLAEREAERQQELERVRGGEFRESLVGTLGRQVRFA